MKEPIRILVTGCGQMGASHARAYHRMDDFEIVGLVSRGPASREALSRELGGCPTFSDFEAALQSTVPDAVSINTYPDTHAEFAIRSMRAGAHVFCEKPLAQTVADAEQVVAVSRETRRKVVVGYILRHHPSWAKFVEIARTLGTPLVMRMNLNQQSSGESWEKHKALLRALPPIVDCGVHYVDMMCLMTGSRPVRVHAIGAHLTDEIETYNYGQLQVVFENGSVGWYEAGWGPMMSETAYFVKDIIGPRGCVSIVHDEGKSDDIDSHTSTSRLRVHYANPADGTDEEIEMQSEPGHQELCDREQAYFGKAIRDDLDLSGHLADAVNSLRIVLAADESVRTGRVVELGT